MALAAEECVVSEFLPMSIRIGNADLALDKATETYVLLPSRSRLIGAKREALCWVAWAPVKGQSYLCQSGYGSTPEEAARALNSILAQFGIGREEPVDDEISMGGGHEEELWEQLLGRRTRP